MPTEPGSPEFASPRDNPPPWRVPILLGILTVLACYTAGLPALSAPFIAGDEHIFIVNNPEVTGAGRNEPALERLLMIFTHAHDDLYQPVPIAAYALEWLVWPGAKPELKAPFIRNTDVLIHALNALLLWGVLSALLARFAGGESSRPRVAVAWVAATLWALHPANVTTYAADMGRTHLLSGTFALAALWLYVAAIRDPDGGWPKFAASVLALALAMASKPVVGWVGLVAALEIAAFGWRKTLRSPRLYVVGAVCVLFAWLTVATSRRAGLLEDAEIALFGDRVSRSLLAAWIYLKSVTAPVGLSTWYLPDVHTGWDYSLVWLGAALLVVCGLAYFVTARRRSSNPYSVGIAWFWALLLPVLGFVGGRVAAAQDRYLYQPLMGVAFLLSFFALRWIAGRPSRLRVALTAGVVACVACLPWDAVLCANARSTIRRAARVVDLNRGDPRATEALAAAYDFSRNHATLEAQSEPVPDFQRLFEQTLDRTVAEAAAAPACFPTDNDRAAFHRRMSRLYLHARLPEPSLKQALAARDIEPDAVLTWLRIANAHRALEQWDDAIRAYDRIESLLKPDTPERAKRLTEYGGLLQDHRGDSAAARERFLAVIEPLLVGEPAIGADPTTRVANIAARMDVSLAALPPLSAKINSDAAYPVALVGLAKAEIRVGQGATGFDLIRRVRAVFPAWVDADLVEGEYHLRSGHWDDAGRVYADVLRREPAHFDGLLGFHEVCAHSGEWRSAAAAWNRAAGMAPPDRRLTIQSFFVWTATCAGDKEAGEWADRLLHSDPGNQFGCLCRMLLALRAGDAPAALDWAAKAGRAQPLPQTRALERAAATLELMVGRGEVLSEADVVRAALYGMIGRREDGERLLDAFIAAHPGAPAASLAGQVRDKMREK